MENEGTVGKNEDGAHELAMRHLRTGEAIMRLRSVSRILVVCVALVGVFASVVSAHADWLLPTRQLTAGPSAQSKAAITGTTLVYWDDVNKTAAGDDGDVAGDIFLRDVVSGAVTLITPAHSAAGGPRISGTKVIWRDSRDWKIHLYNITTGLESILPIKGFDYAISGNRIVFTAAPPIDSDWSWNWAYLYDLSTGKTKRISATTAKAVRPDISGSKVVWVDRRRGGRDIFLYDVTTGTESRITGTGAQDNPDISGDLVAFEDYRNDNWDVYLYNLTTKSEKQVTSDSWQQGSPAISGGRVAYASWWDGPEEVWLYDVFNGYKKQVTSAPERQGFPALFGKYLVYEDHTELEGGDDEYPIPHLWLSEINESKLTATAPSTVSYGAKAKVTGQLLNPSGAALTGATVRLQYSKDKHWWYSGDTDTTSLSGNFTLYSPALRTARYVRVLYKGTYTYASALSETRQVKPKLYFSSAPRFNTYSHRYGYTYRVWGYFKPEHSTGSHQIKVKAYKKQSDGSYAWRKTFSTTVSNSSTSSYSKYAGYVKLTSKGKWRLRAYHAEDSKNAKSYTSYRYVTVY